MSVLDEKGRYCACNSKTNPCIVCGKPKFIDPEWLKRKIEEEPDGMEVGAGFEIFSAPASAATTPADVGKLVERLRERARTMNGAEPVGAGDGHTYTLCYYSAGDRGLDREAATALERVTRERDAIRTKLETVEAETRERAAMLGYAICAETGHVTLGDKVAEAIRNLEPRHD